MLRWHALAEIPTGYGPSVVTIGNFDGVHLGHQQVIRRVQQQAQAEDWAAVAITFYPHPAQVHRPHSAPELIMGLTDRVELMAEAGLDATLVVDYDLEFADQTPRDFVATYLVQGLGAKRVVVGRDVRFGRHNAGDLGVMIDLGQRFGFDVVVIPDVGGGATSRWSSTKIRSLLERGEVRKAAQLLGRSHRVRGEVVHGDARGRELGFPTANLDPHAAGFVPADGVYAGYLTVVDGNADLLGRRLPAAVSVGTNPTFAGTTRRVEAYVLDHTEIDLYGAQVLVEFVSLLRPTLTFTSVADLVTQMHQDVAQVPAALGDKEL